MRTPRRRIGVVESSARVRRTGMKRGQCLAMSWFWECQLLLVCETVRVIPQQ